tara:strand:- start:3021 stop:4436 length:1416 start_codon:yes stop_codon:yes gene_type:complete
VDFKNDFIGYNFTWFIGEVEGRNDPLKLGRVRVRCFGWHPKDKTVLPTTDLPWAQTIQPVTAPAASPTGLTVGVWVFGFFMDGDTAQRPMIMGQIPGYRYHSDGTGESELPKAARVEYDNAKAELLKASIEENSKKRFDPDEFRNSGRDQEQQEADIKQEKEQLEVELAKVNKLESPQSKLRRNTRITDISLSPSDGTTWSEPEEPDDKEYPYVQTVSSEAGFTTETVFGPFDEFKGDFKARQVTYDCSGGYDERKSPSGDKIVKVIGDNYEIVCGSSFVNIKGDVNMTVDGNMKQTVSGDYELNVGGNMYTIVGGTDDKYVVKDQVLGIVGTRDTYIGGVSLSGNVGDKKLVALGGATDAILAGGRINTTIGAAIDNTQGAYTKFVSGAVLDTVIGTRLIDTRGALTQTATSHIVSLGTGTLFTTGTISTTALLGTTITGGTVVSTVPYPVTLGIHTHIETGGVTNVPKP